MRAPQRIWMTGICTRPIHALAAQIADSVTRSGGQLSDWQHDTSGERGVLATWRQHTGLPGSVHVAVVLAEKAGGARWGLCARLDRGWTHGHTSPARLVGLTLPDQTYDPAGVPIANGTLICAPEAQRELTDNSVIRAHAAATWVKDPARSVSLLLVHYDLTEHPSGLSVRDLAALRWPGLVSVLSCSTVGRTELNDHLTGRSVPRLGARWVAASRDSIPDQAVRSERLCDPQPLRDVLTRAIAARGTLPPTGLAATAAQLLDTIRPATTTDPPPRRAASAPHPAEAELAETRQHLDRARHALRDTQRQLDAAHATITQLQQRPDTTTLDTENTELRRALTVAREENLLYAELLDEVEHDNGQLRQHRAVLTARLARLAPEAATDLHATHAADNDEFDSFAALLHAAAALPGIRLGLDPAKAEPLDHHPKAATWRNKSWLALSTISHYASSKTERRARDGAPGPAHASLLAYVKSDQPGALINANIVIPTESDTVRDGAKYRTARTFPVPPAVDPSGEAFFDQHIRLERFQPPAPRLHFYDDTDGATGLVYIGYLGPHLPNHHTN